MASPNRSTNKTDEEGGMHVEKLLSTEEAAHFLNCQPQTLNRWRYERKGPTYVKVGRLVRYSESQLKEWISENVHANTIYQPN